MSSEAPDPRTFNTWEDAFKYPIPVVRKLEQHLRNNANDNRERLRSLVGYVLSQRIYPAMEADDDLGTGRAIVTSLERPGAS
jgi:hypothetical protein